MNSVLAITLIGLGLSACSFVRSGSAPGGGTASSLTTDEKHRLYSAALAVGESPLDAAVFKDVCKTIGIFDASGGPNDRYMSFVGEHLEWSVKPENQEFRKEIDTSDKARKYVNEHLGTR